KKRTLCFEILRCISDACLPVMKITLAWFGYKPYFYLPVRQYFPVLSFICHKKSSKKIPTQSAYATP
ncbi:MAG: hypothetical protein AABY47_07780, partial [Pseudomonadota bacterium]